MIRRPPRSTLDRSSAASDVYKRQDPSVGPAAEVINALKEQDVLVSSPGPSSIRMVTHRHITGSDIEKALAATSKVVDTLGSNSK